MPFSRWQASTSARSIGAPVSSLTWSTRGTPCAPSSVQWKPSPSRSKGTLELLDEKLLHEVGPLARDQRDGLGGAETVACPLDVGGELLGSVAGGTRDDAALGVERVRLAGLRGARDELDRGPAARGGERGRAAGDTGAENENVGSLDRHARSSSSDTSAAATECVSAPTETASTPASA